SFFQVLTMTRQIILFCLLAYSCCSDALQQWNCSYCSIEEDNNLIILTINDTFQTDDILLQFSENETFTPTAACEHFF
ncbi:hypothetical protein MAR_019075, partial [Mya arenaria]